MIQKTPKAGRFITVEGIEGAGKSTNIKYISELITQLGIKHIITREPGGTRIGEKIRELLTDTNNSNMHYMSELLLVFAARQQHIAEVILPHLQKGYWVLCDRFTDASYAYQGGGRDIDTSIIKMLDSLILRSLKIDLTFYFDVSVDVSAVRIKNKNIDRFEIEGSEFMHKVRNAYIKIISKNINRFVVVDASESLEKVQKAIKVALLEKINKFT